MKLNIFDKEQVSKLLKERVLLYKVTTENIDKQYPSSSSNENYAIGFGFVDNNHILSFQIDWSLIQLRVTQGSNLEIRNKYGNNPWSAWRRI